MAHAAHKVAVGGGNAALALGQNAHVAAKAGAAGGGGHDAACINKGSGPAAQDAFLVNGHGGGDDDAAHALGNVLALEHIVGGFHVLQTAVGAAADHNLIDLDVLALAGKVGVLGQVGVADGGFQLVQIDLNGGKPWSHRLRGRCRSWHRLRWPCCRCTGGRPSSGWQRPGR